MKSLSIIYPKNKLDVSEPSEKKQPSNLKTDQPLSPLYATLLLNLQRSLEVEGLLLDYFNVLSSELNVANLSYQHNGLALQYGIGAMHSCDYGLHLNKEPLGHITLTRRQRFSEEDLQTIEQTFQMLILPLHNALRYRQACQAALQDPLTGLGNKMAMQQSLNRALAYQRRQDEPLALLVLDLDLFKVINDTHGHVAGDRVLEKAALCLKQVVREEDEVFRFGGEEFVALLPSSTAKDAALVGERVRTAIEQLHIQHNGEEIKITVSIGIAAAVPDETPERLLERADAALYEAKKNGRNQAWVAQHPAEDG